MDNSPGPLIFPKKVKNTVTGLYRHPAEVVDSQAEGDRGSYLNPYLYVTLSALVLATAAALFVSYPEMSVTGVDPGQFEEFGDELEGFRAEEFQQVLEVVGLRMNTQFLGFLNYLLFPLLALASWIFFRGTHSGYYRHLILNTYAVGQANVALLLLVPVWALFNVQLTEPGIHLYPAAFIIGLVLLMTYNHYFRLEDLKEWLRASSALILGFFAYSLIAGFAIAFITIIVYMLLAMSAAP